MYIQFEPLVFFSTENYPTGERDGVLSFSVSLLQTLTRSKTEF